ncbi:hypothetical protein EST38_g9257 [Candolleomyces aberdarensis]|uniref:Uncharacterized protein n=1 Tax=Candolleomyces aberdarensis TaxID=2316362 RepID=A0A4Q2DAG9_9AGAR|nr:hypothetical protein EST38_g9257 [Candolleomyces aberdarensis]
MAGLRLLATPVPPIIAEDLPWDVASQFIFDLALRQISNVLSTIKLSGLNLIHAGKAVVLASRPGATPVLEIAAAPVLEEVAVPVLEVAPVVDAIAEVTVPVLEVVEEVAPAVNVIAEATVSIVEPVSESLVVEVVATAADPAITSPIIEVVQEIVSPFVSPTVEVSLLAGPLPELLDFTLIEIFDSAGPQFVRPGQMDLISGSVEVHPRVFDATAIYCIFLLSFVLWNWVRCRRIAEPETGFAASRSRSAYSPVNVLQAVSSFFPVPQAAHSPVPIPVLSEGFALDKDLLRVATFQTFVDVFAQQNGLSHPATKELCNSYITGLVPTVVTPASPLVSYEDISLDPQLYLWVGFGSMLKGYREKHQLSHQDLVDLLNTYITRDFRKFWEHSESADGLSGSGAPVSGESTIRPSSARSTTCLSPSPLAGEVAEPSRSPGGDDDSWTSVSPPEGALEKAFSRLNGTPVRRRRASMSDVFVESENSRAVRTTYTNISSESQSDSESDSLTEQAYEARFSRSNAPSPASDIGFMGSGFSESEDRSGSFGNSSDESAEFTEDEEVEVVPIGGSVSSVEEEVTVQDVNEVRFLSLLYRSAP